MSLPAKQESNKSLEVQKPFVGTETILKTDVIIPRLLLMQGLSDMVASRKAQMGDVVRSTTGEKVADNSTPLEFIPLTFKNIWVLQEKAGKKFEFRGTEPRTAQNEDAPWEFEKDGAPWKRVKAVDVFALLPADIEAELSEIKRFQETGEMPDLNKTLLPVVIRFQSTSFPAGRAVVTHFTKAAGMAKFGAKPYGFTLQLSCHSESNDLGTFYVFDVKQGKRVSPAQLERAEEWYRVVTSQPVQIDDEERSSDEDAQANRKAAQQRAREEKEF